MPLQVSDTVEDATTDFTGMNVPSGQMDTFDISSKHKFNFLSQQSSAGVLLLHGGVG